MVDLSVNIGGLTLANPVMPASGTFSPELASVVDLNRLGALVTKSITREFRAGNPVPRVVETPSGMLNSIGIPSQGIDYFLNTIIPAYRAYSPPLVASISADTAAEFGALARDVGVRDVDVIEINISCPNLEAEGNAVALQTESTVEVVRMVRAATEKPIWAKLSPNAGNIVDVARAAEEGGADAVVVANTLLAMTIDTGTFRPTLGSVTGGLSGPAVLPVILRMVHQCARALSIPVIGCGGISSTGDTIQYLLAGARAVQVGTITFRHPGAMTDIIDGLEQYCGEHGIAAVEELVGAVRLEPVAATVQEAIR